ncbi:serine/threonine-protein kinase (plasmid) [Nocardia sp. CA-129566]|uniref:serine/threonine-protein kinase n=1 Tax=Nocardia sp. CA-129566 TaxID=3239976 RepID=UPI003D99B6D3
MSRTVSAQVGDTASLIVDKCNAADFMEMLRRLQQASGRNPGQISKYAELPRSTAYHFASSTNHSLPRKAEQLEKFCRGCKLTPEEIDQVMRNWARLGGAGGAAVQPKSSAVTAEDPTPQMQDRLLDDPAGQRPVTIGGSVRDVHIIYNIASDPASSLKQKPRRPRQLSSIVMVLATAVTVSLMIDLVAAPSHLTRAYAAAWQAPLSQTTLCAVVLLWMVLGVLRRIGYDERRLAWSRLRSWSALAAMPVISLTAGTAVGFYSPTPVVAGTATAAMTWAVTALWFASIDLGELRRVLAHAPALAALGLIFGAGTSAGIGVHRLPLAPAAVAGGLTAAAIMHLLGKIVAPLIEARDPLTAIDNSIQKNTPLTHDNITTPTPPADMSPPGAQRPPTGKRHRRSRKASRRQPGWGRARRNRRRDTANLVNIGARRRRTSELPPLPRRAPWAHTFEDLLGLTPDTSFGGLGRDSRASVITMERQSVPAYEIIARIRREREQASGREPGGARTGTQLGPYRLQALLGKGKHGEVYEAYDENRYRVVALKLISGKLANNHHYIARLQEDTRAAAELWEPHIIPIHNWGVIDEVPFIDMGLGTGTDLQRKLSHGSLAPHDAVDIVEQIASALDAAHDSGLAHGNVKPSNILLTHAGFASLVDFGTAPNLDEIAMSAYQLDPDAYTAPETLHGNGQATPATDVYSLACVLYACLTGAEPSGENKKPLPLSNVQPWLRSALAAVLSCGMAKNPIDRYVTPTALARAARAAVGPAPTQPANPALPRRTPGEAAALEIPGWAEKNGILRLDSGLSPTTTLDWGPDAPSNKRPIPPPLPNTGYRGIAYDVPADYTEYRNAGYELTEAESNYPPDININQGYGFQSRIL